MSEVIMAFLIKPTEIKVRCPYCANLSFWVEHPPGESSRINDGYIEQTIPEVECLPYTRDIGRFDNKGWTKIGSDFHSKFLGWERIGILRTVPEQKVYYRVVLCLHCKYQFEVYANYTPGISFNKMWPHLFSKSQDNGIEQNKGMTLTQKKLDRGYSTLFFVCIIFLISFIPDIVGEWKTLKTSGGFELFIASNWTKLLMRGTSCLSLLCILRISFGFIHYLEEDNGLEKLFKISNKRGLTYWKNFTRARFVGVKVEEDNSLEKKEQKKKGQLFSVNQIIAGIPAVVVLLLVWISDQAIKTVFQPSALLLILLVPIFYTIGALVPSLCQQFYPKVKKLLVSNRASAPPLSSGRGESDTGTEANWILPIKGGGILVSIIGLFVSLICLTKIYQNQSVLYITTTLFELGFWIIISYYIGICTWNILEIPVYILKGVKKIPMNLDPLDRFKNLSALERLSQKSIAGMVILFVLALLLSVCHAFSPIEQQSEWIVIWAQAAFIGLYIVIAIILEGTSRIWLVLLVILYVLLQLSLRSSTFPGLPTKILTSLNYVPFKGPLRLYECLSLALFGAFSSYIFYLQIREINKIFKSLREEYKNRKLEFYRGFVDDIEIQLQKANSHSNKAEESAHRQSLLGSVNELISIIDKINREPVNVLGYKQVTGVISPFMSTIALPLIINYITPFIPNPWIK